MSGTAFDRRSFLVGLAASLAARSALGKAADAAETPLLRLGIVSDSHCRFLHDPADRKTWGAKSTAVLQHALEKFRAWGVDAVVHPGDFTEYGMPKELEVSGAVWRRVFPEDVGEDGGRVEKLFVRGNHDVGREPDPQTNIGTNPAKAWKDAFGIDWYTEKVMLRTVKGYTFVLADWGTSKKELDDFFVAHEKDLPKTRPFFYVQHAPPAGTVDKAQDEFGDRSAATAASARGGSGSSRTASR